MTEPATNFSPLRWNTWRSAARLSARKATDTDSLLPRILSRKIKKSDYSSPPYSSSNADTSRSSRGSRSYAKSGSVPTDSAGADDSSSIDSGTSASCFNSGTNRRGAADPKDDDDDDDDECQKDKLLEDKFPTAIVHVGKSSTCDLYSSCASASSTTSRAALDKL